MCRHTEIQEIISFDAGIKVVLEVLFSLPNSNITDMLYVYEYMNNNALVQTGRARFLTLILRNVHAGLYRSAHVHIFYTLIVPLIYIRFS